MLAVCGDAREDGVENGDRRVPFVLQHFVMGVVFDPKLSSLADLFSSENHNTITNTNL